LGVDGQHQKYYFKKYTAFPTMGRFFMTQRRIYQEEYPYFVTFRTLEGYPLFEDEKITGLFAHEIVVSAHIKQYDVLAWQIMPEHVHLLVYKTDRTLESVRSAAINNDFLSPIERTFSKVRSDNSNTVRSHPKYVRSD
jgi:REP element-mobilizing transposase RayT